MRVARDHPLEIRMDRGFRNVLNRTKNERTPIKEVGGITIAQKPSTASQPDMPESAIDSGCIDFVLSPEEIAQKISLIASAPTVNEHGTTPVLNRDWVDAPQTHASAVSWGAVVAGGGHG